MMSDAPDRIWAWTWNGEIRRGQWSVNGDLTGESEYIRADLVPQWRSDMENAPSEEPHTRGMWVFNARTGKPMYFAANTGYIDERGDFVGMDSDDDFGWSAEDYDYWCLLPMPLPEPPEPR